MRSAFIFVGTSALLSSVAACAASGSGGPIGGFGASGNDSGGTGGDAGGGSGAGGGAGAGGTSGSGAGGSGNASSGGSSGVGGGAGGAGAAGGAGGGASGSAGVSGSGPGAGGSTGSGGTANVSDLIDDMESGTGSILTTNGRVGAWYTYNDESAAGSQAPAMGASFLPDAGGVSGGHAAHTAGSGFTVWGAGMGFDLNNDGVAKGTYDASGYTGFAFWAKGTQFRVKVLVPATVPSAEGGACSGTGCGDNHGKVIVASTSWQQHVIPFSALVQEGWGSSAPLSSSELIGIQFQATAGATFDIWIDDIGFY